MHIERVPNRNSPPAVLLRESYREGGKVKKRTLANLSHWPDARIEQFRAFLKGATVGGAPSDDAFEIIRIRPHGHVAATLASLRRGGVHRMLARSRSKERDIIEALIVARVIEPRSKLATVRGLHEDTLNSSLGELLGLTHIDEDDIYAAMDWLLGRQEKIEQALAKRHLVDGTLVLYDLTSTWYEGRTCPLAARGYSRDGKKGTLQINFGLLCDRDGRPVAVEVFEGNTADPATVATQVDKLRKRFQLERVVLVGDRGMITSARIRDDLRSVEGLEWISALRNEQIRKLVNAGSLQLSLFDQQDLAEFHDPAFPDERLVACRNPLLAEERARKRNELLAATQKELDKVIAATKRKRAPLTGRVKIARRVERVAGKYKMAKHFDLEITDTSFSYRRNDIKVAEEARLDGIYVIRTSVPETALSAEQSVEAYKSLSSVERAFRSFKTVDLKVRPIHHHLADRVRSHIFLCMLAYYVEWHMRRDLAPLLFDDDDRLAAKAQRKSIVAPAQRSASALAKAKTKRNADGQPVHSFRTLLDDLSSIVRNTCKPTALDAPTFEKTTRPTPLQQRALDLLGARLAP
jgi:transposase